MCILRSSQGLEKEGQGQEYHTYGFLTILTGVSHIRFPDYILIAKNFHGCPVDKRTNKHGGASSKRREVYLLGFGGRVEGRVGKGWKVLEVPLCGV